MTWTRVARIPLALVLGTGLAVAVGAPAPAQLLDPAEESGEPFSMEGKSLLQQETQSSGPLDESPDERLMQDDPIASDPPGARPEQPLGNVGGIEIQSDPNAPLEANEIMDNFGNNTGMPPPGD